MCRLFCGRESKLPELFHHERAERSADEPDLVSVHICRSPPCIVLGLQYSAWPTSEGYGTGGAQPDCGLRHALRRELCWLPWHGGERGSFDRPCQSRLSCHCR